MEIDHKEIVRLTHRSLSTRCSSECCLCESDGIPELLLRGVRPPLPYRICICFHWCKRPNTSQVRSWRASWGQIIATLVFFLFLSLRPIHACLVPVVSMEIRRGNPKMSFIKKEKAKQASPRGMDIGRKQWFYTQHVGSHQHLNQSLQEWQTIPVCWALRHFLGCGTFSAKIMDVTGMVGHLTLC